MGTGILALAAAGCFLDREDGWGPGRPVQHSGMVSIRAAGKAFQQGSSTQPPSSDEWPAFRNRFTYDFALDTTEVTQGRYAALMGSSPASSVFGSGADYPVYGVSWFDAALYANARSKAAGMDTVYEYERVLRAASGSVYDLPGLRTHLERLGYRLPTEAEWEFAAGAGGGAEYVWGNPDDTAPAARNAWYAANSAGSVHRVAGLAANGFGLYDMAGNVMEWVGDWKGRYPQDSARDFAGARDPGPQAEAPVKGGSFRSGLHDLRISNRSATYAALRSSNAEYVGFRCALGAIPAPRFSLPDGRWAETQPVRLELTRLAGLVEGRAAKLVFVNATQDVRHLAYVDFARQPIRVREFGDARNVFHPSISPDGLWVAYGTAAEGAVSGSELGVRRLDSDSAGPISLGPGFIPRWWVDPATRDTFLVYTTTGADDLQSTWSGGGTLARKMEGGKPVGPPVALAGGAFHDGRSRDGRWLATGFRRLRVRDGVAGSTRTLFTAPENGKAAGDTSQVCNVSIAPDSTGRVLFLDFGYDGTSALTGSWYDIHAVAFMAGPDGKVLGWYPAPRGEKAWDDLEWSNVPRFAVAAATDPGNGHGRLYLLDLADSSSALLASGTYLTTPALWLGASQEAHDPGLSPDSLGRYNEPATDTYQGTFAMKMARFWERHRRLELIFTGSSHVLGGIDPRLITRYQTLDAAYAANGWLGQEEWVRAYALPHCPKLKVLIMEAFPGWMHFPDGDFTWRGQMSQTLGVKYDSAHGFWKEGLPAGFEAMAARAPSWDGWIMDSLGTVSVPTGGWGDITLPTDADFRYEDAVCQGVLARMEAFAREVSARGIHLLWVNYPTHPGFKSTPYYGPYGPRTTEARKIIDRLRGMEKISPYIHFYDAQLFGDHDYADADANNWGHLSSTGAVKLTSRLDSLVNSFRP